MSEWISLSFELSRNTPLYGGGQAPLHLKHVKSPACGDSCEVSEVMIQNHWGTHFDCPAHFFPDGRRVGDYSVAELIFTRVQWLEIPLSEGRLIEIADLEGRLDSKTDLLLIKTGFERFRENADQYGARGPGLSEAACLYLRKFTNLRAIGFDFVSLSSFLNRDEGRKAHRAILSNDGRAPILVVEDMKLSELRGEIEELHLVPLRVEGLDSAPCTVLARVSR